MDWNDLKVFLALDREGSARAAAARLSTSHSTVLRRLDTLETALSTRLFDRTPDGLVLTAAGARLSEKAQRIEAEMLDAQRDLSGTDVRLQGPIRLTLPPIVAQYLLLPHLARFRALYPDITLDIVPTDAFADLNRRDADLAIRFSETPADHLVGRRLPPFHDAIYAAPGDPPPHWIGWSDEDAFRRRIRATPFARAPIAWAFPGLELQAAAARDGLGMALLPCIMGDSDPRLVRLPGSGTYPTLPGWILTHPDLRRMERVRVLARFLHDALSGEADRIAGHLP